MIKNIIFDLGGVILQNSPITIMDHLKIDSLHYNLIYKHFFSNLSILDKGYISLEEYLSKCNLPIMLKNKYKQILFHYYKYRKYNDDIIEIINILKENKYKIYILSNNNKETYNFLIHQDIFKNIDGWIISCNYHICKPEKEIYNILLEKHHLKNSECFFIDDNKKILKLQKH